MLMSDLEKNIQYLKGVGPAKALLLNKLQIFIVTLLLFVTIHGIKIVDKP